MRYVLFSRGTGGKRVGIRRGDRIYDVSETEVTTDGDLSPLAAVLSASSDAGAGHAQPSESFRADVPVYDREEVSLRAPLAADARIICLGGVYTNHLRERGVTLNRDPNQWVMPSTAVIGPDEPIRLPDRQESEVVPAVELGVVVGAGGKYISEEDAFDHVAGYTVVNDVTDRGEYPGPMGYKMLDTFSPCGPHVTTTDEVPDPLSLELTVKTDGETICRGSTAGMHFTVSFLVSYLSTFMRLRPGDVLSTGDPAGVEGVLEPGATVDLDIESVGTLSNEVVRESDVE
jgi:2-keto-4-pentenoate hydratase/2-oxohepta-3-ene-1,7-dioic acid hydratase in catechol pathway